MKKLTIEQRKEIWDNAWHGIDAGDAKIDMSDFADWLDENTESVCICSGTGLKKTGSFNAWGYPLIVICPACGGMGGT